MQTSPDPWISALRHSHDRLQALVDPLGQDQLKQRSYASEWSIAQVLSHLGSGAEIFGLFLEAGLAGQGHRGPVLLGFGEDHDLRYAFRPVGEVGTFRDVPLGRLCGARSGDKGGNANVGLWARHPEAFGWLREELTVERFRQLLPEAAGLQVRRYELPNLHALNFVVVGLLGEGVAASTRPDPQAKGLGEYLRSRHMDIPAALLG